MNLIGKNLPLICLSAMLCCVCGVLLWVNSGSTLYTAKKITGNCGSLTGVFLISCVSYCLHGIVMAVSYLHYKCRILDPHLSYVLFCRNILSFIFHLMWYVIHFCTILTIFALVPVVISAVMLIANLFSTIKHHVILSIIDTIQLVITAYFGVLAVLSILT